MRIDYGMQQGIRTPPIISQESIVAFPCRQLVLISLVAMGVMAHDARRVRAEEFRIATWNVHEGMSVERIRGREQDFRRFGQTIKPDLLLIEEVTSLQVVEAVRDAMGLKGYYCACSDFSPADEPDFSCLEVGIISRFPFNQVIEFDVTPDRDGTKPETPAELPLLPLIKLGISRPPDDNRGFLWARIDSLRLTVAAVHLKSSRGVDGAEDRLNAVKREFVAAALAQNVNDDRLLWPDMSCLVGGDINVGHADMKKNGVDLRADFDQPGPDRDGYDDTHAIFRGGIIGGLRMRNLIGHTTEPTYPSFPSSPIDNLYVVGPAAHSFANATIHQDTFGSDHRPVVSVFTSKIYPAGATVDIQTTAVRTIQTGAPIATATDIVPVHLATRFAGQRATVELVVKSGTVMVDRSRAFLNSESDYKVATNFTVVVPGEVLAAFKTAGIDDPIPHFRDQTVRVTGVISLRQDRPQIVLSDRGQLVIVPQAANKKPATP